MLTNEMNILQAMKDALDALKFEAGFRPEKYYEKQLINLSTAIEEMERAEPVAWSLWQPFGGHVQFTGNQKLATQYGLRADVMVTPLYLHPTPTIPDGWKLVPIEPTLKMIGAAEDQADCLGDFYRAMLAAAPEYKP